MTSHEGRAPVLAIGPSPGELRLSSRGREYGWFLA